MLSIDEAIAREKNLAEIYRNDIVQKEDYHNMPWIDMANEGNEKAAQEHEQLAEWLEELKAIKDGSKAIRNEAIDDFVHECDKHCGFYSGKNKSITREDILKIAEQLKE